MMLRWPVRGLRALLMAAAALGAQAGLALPDFDSVRESFRSSETVVLDRHGEEVQRLRQDMHVRRGQWVTLEEVSPALRTAMVLSEDKRFWQHSGVDWTAASAAAWGNAFNRKTRGASTITMQLAALLDEDYRVRGRRNVAQKMGQAVAARVLDRRWSKTQILEAYLNLVPFRGEMEGIDALSQTLFGKAPHGLDARESAIAAALVRSPNARADVVARRACAVWRGMRQDAQLDCAGLEMMTALALKQRRFAASQGVAPHFARHLLGAWQAGEVPQQVRSSLDAPLQRFAVQSLQQHLRELSRHNVEDGAVLVLDNATGQVLAWVGSSGQLSQAGEVDAVLARRQPGSTLKPFLYAQAIAQQRLTAASLLDDSPQQIQTGGGLYIPQNHDMSFSGWVTVRTALASSINLPAVRTLVMVTPEAFAAQLAALGIELPESGDYYGYSLALGSADMSLLALTNAYRALANGGRHSPVTLGPQAVADASAAHQALDERAAFIVGDILADRNARMGTFGQYSVLETPFWTAVKTGTSKDMRDNWAVGWSQHYTVGVWVGNASGAPMHDVIGTSGAAPVWRRIMGFLHAQRPSAAPQPPAGVVRQWVTFGTGLKTDDDGRALPLEAARQEWFLPGTQQEQFALSQSVLPASRRSSAAEQQARITSPVSGTIVALDPDIPPDNQRLRFQASVAAQWVLDGELLASTAAWDWLPQPGRHVVQLQAADGAVLDEVQIEVRGARRADNRP